MSEFITLHLGGAGVNVGNSYWDLVLNEHQTDHSGHIDPIKQTQYSNRAFQEKINGTFAPRALFIDTDDLSLNNLLKSKNWQRFEHLTECLNEESSGIFAKVKYEIFPKKKEKLFDRIRKLTEACDKLESFFLFFGSGGTGSGLGAAFCESIKDEFTNVSLSSTIIYPCKELGKSVIEAYNSIISTSSAISNSDIVYAYDNFALHNMCINNLSEPYSSYRVINDTIAHSLANMTSVFRFSNTKISDFQGSLVFDNCLKTISPGFSPITLPGNSSNDWKSICMGALEPSNTMVKSELINSNFRNAKFVFRGEISRNESEIILMQLKQEVGFGDGNFEIFNMKEAGELIGNFVVGDKTVGILSNSSIAVDVLERIKNEFETMILRRCYVFWYVKHGMDEFEFFEKSAYMYNLMDQCKNVSN